MNPGSCQLLKPLARFPVLHYACDEGIWPGEVVSTFGASYFSTVFTQFTPSNKPNCIDSHSVSRRPVNMCNSQNRLSLWELGPKF